MAPEPFFLNVDLDIESAIPLGLLVREFGKRVSVMYSGRMKRRHCLFVEVVGPYKNAEKTIHALCKLIESLSPSGRQLWNAAKRKEFDIGYEIKLASHRANRFSIETSTLRRVTRLGASLAITLYREDKPKAKPKKGSSS